MTRKSSLYRYTLVLTIWLPAVLLVALSWPRLKASVIYLPVDTAISKYWQTGKFENAQLGGLIDRAAKSIAIHDHYRYYEGMSDLKILSRKDMNRSVWQRRQDLEDSILAAEEVVRRAPVKPRMWLRIATAKELLVYPAEEIIPALKMSVFTGRVEPTLMLTRLELGLRLLPAMDEEAVRLLRDQAVLTWTIQKKPMLMRIKSGSLNLVSLREALSKSYPAILAEIEANVLGKNE